MKKGEVAEAPLNSQYNSFLKMNVKEMDEKREPQKAPVVKIAEVNSAPMSSTSKHAFAFK